MNYLVVEALSEVLGISTVYTVFRTDISGSRYYCSLSSSMDEISDAIRQGLSSPEARYVLAIRESETLKTI